ncbi:uncharacterized protein LACBIDRAFT_295543 [Laccaria bicolor S238N-H82]|uniref:Predicted protein n=1 Tax=Laccaria bicolor (strain S238N-H82 / ATCC MYA-4686) TaxID=486041 RepID=B0DUG5_LACBS|nr:uncharacterized protein LACBIDRAFT_295543 [Laccaria bicolor S238N-H82]EDR01802.1 predicted protein [Laccaria bicolor S238N-H82]|eukprot:XP_001887615.1 predicted protein [Laccaria bicolor S238N-H82]
MPPSKRAHKVKNTTVQSSLDGQEETESVISQTKSEHRNIYYRLYTKEGPLESNNPIFSNDPFISRISSKSVRPPHTAASLKKCICKIEDVEGPQMGALYSSLSEREPLEDSARLVLRGNSESEPGPGSSEVDPIILVVDKGAAEKRPKPASNTGSNELPTWNSEREYIYYRLYDDDSEAISKTSFDENDSSLGRIDIFTIPPPHTVASLKNRLVHVEEVSSQNVQLLENEDGEVTLNDDDALTLLTDDVPGSNEDRPMVFTYTQTAPDKTTTPEIPSFSKRLKATGGWVVNARKSDASLRTGRRDVITSLAKDVKCSRSMTGQGGCHAGKFPDSWGQNKFTFNLDNILQQLEPIPDKQGTTGDAPQIAIRKTCKALSSVIAGVERLQISQTKSEHRNIYYRLYTKEGPLESNNPIFSNDSFISCISSKSVRPPHTAASLKKCICKMEGVEGLENCALYSSLSEREPLDDSARLALRGNSEPGPGSSKVDPVIFVVDKDTAEKRPKPANNPGSKELPTWNEQQYVYYRLYDDDSEAVSKTSFDESDTSLGRIDIFTIPPPHTVTSLKDRLVHVEGVAGSDVQLYKTEDGEVTLNDGDAIDLLSDDFPGLNEDQPIVFTYTRKAPGQTMASGIPIFSRRLTAKGNWAGAKLDATWHSMKTGEIFQTDGVQITFRLAMSE